MYSVLRDAAISDSPDRFAHRYTLAMSCPPTAAACISPARATAALSDQNTISPSIEVSPIRAAARRTATSGEAHPAMMSGRNVLGIPPTPYGLNTCTGPSRARVPAVSSYRSARVVNDTHAPRWDSIHSPRNPDLPTRGGAMIAAWCSRGEDPLEILRPAQPPR